MNNDYCVSIEKDNTNVTSKDFNIMHNIYEKNSGFRKISLFIIILVFSIVSAIISYEKYKTETELSNLVGKGQFFMIISIFICIFSLVNIFVFFLERIIRQRFRHEFISVLIAYNWFLISLILANIKFIGFLIIFSSVDGISSENKAPINHLKSIFEKIIDILSEMVSDSTDSSDITNVQTIANESGYHTVIRCIVLFETIFILLFFKRCIFQYISFYVHHNYFNEKIYDNKRNMNYINKLKKKCKKKHMVSSKNIAGEIFDQLLFKDRAELKIENFIKNFGKEDGEIIFRLFDENEDNSVNKEEFIRVYLGILKDQDLLRFTMVQKDRSFEKIELLLTIIFLPMFILVICEFFGKMGTAIKIFGIFIGFTLTFSFIFSDTLSTIFDSFIFMFFIRPFDHGDLISIGEKQYTVHEIGFFITSVISDSGITNFSNSLFKRMPIQNHRKSKYMLKSFIMRYEYESFKRKIDEFSSKIQEFLLKNSKMFKKKFIISDYIFKEKNIIQIKISIKLNVPYEQIDENKTREDHFLIFIYETASEIGMKQL